jgi:hypothetical protein
LNSASSQAENDHHDQPFDGFEEFHWSLMQEVPNYSCISFFIPARLPN